MTRPDIDMVQDDVFRIRGTGKGSHSYIIRGSRANMLIDSGLDSNFPLLQDAMSSMGMKVRDIDIVVNTHTRTHVRVNMHLRT